MILTACQETGAHPDTFRAVSHKLGNKTPGEVSVGQKTAFLDASFDAAPGKTVPTAERKNSQRNQPPNRHKKAEYTPICPGRAKNHNGRGLL